MPIRSRGSPYGDLLAGHIAFKLPLRFNARQLARDLRDLAPDAWKLKAFNIPNSYSHNAVWESLTLRGPRRRQTSGEHNLLTSGPFVDYDSFRRSARLARVVAAFPGQKTAVLLFKLKAKGAVTRHVDPLYRYKGREMVPIHVALTTNPGTRFLINGQPLTMRAGEVWAINATLPHEVYNMGGSDRVHMLLHVLFDEDVAALFARSRKIKDVPARARGAAGLYARRYLDALSRRMEAAPVARKSASREAGRKAAVVAQFLKLQVGAGA